MDVRTLFTTFGMIFLAELGDKTQLATFAFATETKSRFAVFLGSAGALVLTSFLAVIFGSAVSRMVSRDYIRIGAAALFILLGLRMLLFPPGK
ncbi:MAG: TMEM165/GDT1 family protein [Thermodesulfobacteriota bacterium]|nr:TMEM165/GDT1 family protein [Thermodesulfobacteriota bacterium]